VIFTIPKNSVAENKNTTTPQVYLKRETGVNATKLAPLVLICVVALAVVAGLGFALSCSVPQQMEEAYYKNNTEIKFANVWAIHEPFAADPIDDPKPN